jgi:poly(3-hydroxybutyrate) depolymerase
MATVVNTKSKTMRRDSDGVTLRGWFYVPDGAKKPVPTVIMAHGFSCLKEMFLDKYAEVFV